MIPCPRCGAKTKVVETRAIETSARRRRGCSVIGCAGKLTTVEIVVRDGRVSPLAKGYVAVPVSVIAKLREILAALDGGEL